MSAHPPDSLASRSQVAEAVSAALSNATANKAHSIEADRFLRSSPPAWPALLSLLSNDRRPDDQVFFYVFSLLEHYAKSSHDEVRGMRERFTSFLLNSLANNLRLASFVRTKAAAVIVRCLLSEYLTAWQSAIKEMSEWWSHSPLHADMFLRICLGLNDHLTAEGGGKKEEEQRVKIKDKVREGDVALLINIWGLLLTDLNQSSLVLQSLRCIAGYAPWVDVSLTAEPQLLSRIYVCLQREEFRCEAMDCLSAVVGKGMPVADKLKLVVYLNLSSVFEGALKIGEEGDEEFFERVCRLLTVCCVALSHHPPIVPDVLHYTLSALSPILAAYLNGAEGIESRLSLAPAANALSEFWAKSKATQSPGLSDLFKAVLAALKQPDDFDLESPGEAEELFPELRQSLIVAFDHLLYLCGQQGTLLVLELIGISASPSFVQDRELGYYLGSRYCDANRGYSFSITTGGERRETSLGQVVRSALTAKQYPDAQLSVYLSYIDCVSRYTQTTFFEVFPDSLLSVLSNVIIGFGSTHSDVQKRAFACFNRLIRCACKHGGPSLVSDLSSVCIPIITASSYDMDVELFVAKLEFYEAFGYLQGQNKTLPIDLFANQLAAKFNDPLLAARILKSIGAVLKGYAEATERQSVDGDSVNRLCVAAVELIDRHPHVVDLFEAGKYFCQRTLGLVRTGSLPLLQRLIIWSLSADDEGAVSSALQVLSPSIFKLKNDCIPLLRNIWIPLSNEIYRLSAAVGPNGDDPERSIAELRRQTMALLIALFSANIAGEALALGSQPLLQVTTDTLQDSDFGLKRSALSVFSRLSTLPTRQSLDLLAQLVIPRSLSDLLVIPRNQLNESHHQAFLNELCNLLMLYKPVLFSQIAPVINSTFPGLDYASTADQRILKAAILQFLTNQ